MEQLSRMAGASGTSKGRHEFSGVLIEQGLPLPLLAHNEIFLQRKTRSLSGRGRHRASLTPFNLAEATD